MKKPIKALFVSHNPGGFNAILPVYLKLKKNHDFKVLGIFEKEAKSINKVKSIKFTDSHKINLEDLTKFFKKKKVNILIAGTSQGKTIDKKAIQVAMELKIPSLAIVDFWSNYKMRFSDPNTENLKYLPNLILAIDKICESEMIKDGISKKKIVITGNPYFDSYLGGFNNLKSSNGKIITFFCQPFSEIKEIDWGFNEIEVFQDFVKVFEKLGLKNKIVIKMHPRTKNFNKFNKIKRNCTFKIKIDRKTDPDDLIKKSFLITGMNSVILLKAAIAGRKVLSYQPKLSKKDSLVSNRWNLSKAVYRKADLFPSVKRLIETPVAKIHKKDLDKYFDGRSTSRVIKAIYQMTNK